MAEKDKVEARVLVDCQLGKVDDVVLIDKKQIEALSSICDADEDAVAYAKSLVVVAE